MTSLDDLISQQMERTRAQEKRWKKMRRTSFHRLGATMKLKRGEFSAVNKSHQWTVERIL